MDFRALPFLLIYLTCFYISYCNILYFLRKYKEEDNRRRKEDTLNASILWSISGVIFFVSSLGALYNLIY